jgi:outer membrane lipoprotein-sorting protein
METKTLVKQFKIAFVILIIFLAWSGCSKKSNQATTSSDADGLQVTSSSANAHTHTVKVLFADLTNSSSAGITYTSSSNGHTHTIYLTQQQLIAINNGSTVTIVSSVDSGHSHNWVISKP